MARRKKDKVRLTHAQRRARGYSERNRLLASMGYPSYAAYLKSGLWRGIRARVLEATPECFVCDEPANQVHHLAYRKVDMEGKDLRKLRALCAGCHRRIEFRDADNEKLSVSQATAKMKQMVTLRKKAEAEAARPKLAGYSVNAYLAEQRKAGVIPAIPKSNRKPAARPR